MKTISTLALAGALAFIGTSAAFADDPQLQNRLAIERQAAKRFELRTNNRGQQYGVFVPVKSQRHETTVAVYADNRGVGQANRATPRTRTAERFELRTNNHGQQYGVFVPVK